ncbi:phage baseplate assembly protein V [Glaciimonas sp. PCH181]|uniref:phage baseplate assembly protein V n=1 Tax=Glaciimonas sp. PCH181 TaxID=2133943 RepID=UPI000D33D77A|nr:phage baseplate assembly protein V [Glaciimonas sp. PCH181]PUA19574.1 phage baseplate assembly protein V [Glaciimonas sp. PCH181]
MRAMLNVMRQQATQVMGEYANTRLGTVQSYDAGNYSVRVAIQPEGNLTGWIPLLSPWVGNGWGMFCPPSIGDMVEVQFQESDHDAAMCCMRLYNDQNRPLSVPSGEFWMVHKTGSALKFHNDGSIEVIANTTASYTATQHNFHGPVTMDQTLQVLQQITGQGGAAISGGAGASMTITGNTNFVGSVTANGHAIDDTHLHSNGNGGANTGTPL